MIDKRYLVVEKGILVHSFYEACLEAEGTPIIEGTFQPTIGTWTGVFESTDGQVYEINDGYVKEVVA